TTSSSTGVGVIVAFSPETHSYFGPPAWHWVDVGYRLGYSTGGGGPVIEPGQRGYVRFHSAGASQYEMQNLDLARSLIQAYQCSVGDEWYWQNGYSTQASYCFCS